MVESLPLVAHLAVTTSHEESFGVGLELRDDLGQLFIAHVFQGTQDTSSEEHLGEYRWLIERDQVKNDTISTVVWIQDVNEFLS
jgi:hypothetical protein